jgi:hypothetical protein
MRRHSPTGIRCGVDECCRPRSRLSPLIRAPWRRMRRSRTRNNKSTRSLEREVLRCTKTTIGAFWRETAAPRSRPRSRRSRPLCPSSRVRYASAKCRRRVRGNGHRQVPRRLHELAACSSRVGIGDELNSLLNFILVHMLSSALTLNKSIPTQ